MPPNGKAAAVDRILPEARYSAEWGSSERGLLNPDPSTGFSSLDGQEQIRTMDGACQQNGRVCWECARRVAEESRFLPLVGMTRLWGLPQSRERQDLVSNPLARVRNIENTSPCPLGQSEPRCSR